MMRRTWFLILIIVIVGCRGPETEEGAVRSERSVREAVVLYANLLIDSYRQMDMNPLLGAATAEQTQKAFHHMAALREGGVLMIAELRQLLFTDIALQPSDRAVTTTEEKWHYAYAEVASKKRVFEVTDRYSVRYFLIRQGERWLVDEVQILSSKRLEGKGSPSPFERPEGIASGQRARPTS